MLLLAISDKYIFSMQTTGTYNRNHKLRRLITKLDEQAYSHISLRNRYHFVKKGMLSLSTADTNFVTARKNNQKFIFSFATNDTSHLGTMKRDLVAISKSIMDSSHLIIVTEPDNKQGIQNWCEKIGIRVSDIWELCI